MTLPGSQSETPFSNFGVSLLRTYVPVAWGALVGWLLTLLPFLQPALEGEGGEGLLAGIIGVSIAVWYFLARLIEPRLPPLLTALIIGANTTPTYLGGPQGEQQARIERQRPGGF